MNKKLKIILWIIVALLMVAVIGYSAYSFYSAKTEQISHPQVSFEIENYGTVKMELYPEYAPNTVANIIKLVELGYYNGKTIYGKDEVCMYVGRNAEGEITPTTASFFDSSIEVGSETDYEYSIFGEFVLNGYEKNTLRHEKGVVSLIRNDYTQYFPELTEESYNSGSSQIGIMINDARNLNGVYAGFGRIIEGLDILEKIYSEEKIKVEESADGEVADTAETIEVFETGPVIKTATVDTFGHNYGTPEIEEAFDYTSYLNDVLSQYYTTEEEHNHDHEGHTH